MGLLLQLPVLVLATLCEALQLFTCNTISIDRLWFKWLVSRHDGPTLTLTLNPKP